MLIFFLATVKREVNLPVLGPQSSEWPYSNSDITSRILSSVLHTIIIISIYWKISSFVHFYNLCLSDLTYLTPFLILAIDNNLFDSY